MTALALALCLALPALPAQAAPAAWDGSAASAYEGGRGIKDGPYIISTAAQLTLFRNQVNAGQDDLCAQVVDNLDMGMKDWVSIGLSAQGYRGMFDGNGYAIRNLKINRFSSGASTSAGSTLYGGGLFGIAGRSGKVRHVNVDGVVSADSSVSVYPDTGAICGGNMGVVEECSSTCDVRDFNLTVESIQDDTGGATIENCYSVVTLKAQSDQPCYTGGMIGSLEAEGLFRNLYTRDGVNFLGRNPEGETVDSGLSADAELKDSAMLAKLGAAFSMDKEKVNQGYPILAVMAYEETANQNNWYTTNPII